MRTDVLNSCGSVDYRAKGQKAIPGHVGASVRVLDPKVSITYINAHVIRYSARTGYTRKEQQTEARPAFMHQPGLSISRGTRRERGGGGGTKENHPRAFQVLSSLAFQPTDVISPSSLSIQKHAPHRFTVPPTAAAPC